ncbi:phage tail tape measure protein [bacterium]|nr:phage tail tape measure protein [bacterium]
MALFADALIRIQTDATQAKAGIKDVDNELDALDASVQSFGTTMAGVSAGLLGISATLSGIYAYSVMQFQAYEKELVNIQAIAGLTNEETSKLWELGIKSGQDYMQSADEVAFGMEKLARGGYDVAQIMESIGPIMNMATAANESFDESAQLVVRTLAAYEMETEKAQYVSDLYAKAMNISQTELVNYTTAMKYIGPVAHSVGWSLKDMVAILSFLYDRGIDASTAATGLRTIILRLQSPTRETRKAIEELGISLRDINPNLNTPVQIIEKFQKASEELSGEKYKDLIGRIFGKYAFASAIAMIDDTEGALKTYQDRLENVTGYSNKVASVELGTMAAKFKKLFDIINTGAIVSIVPFANAIKSVLDSLIGLSKLIANMDKDTVRSIGNWTTAAIIFTGVAGAITALAAAVTLALPALETFAAVLTTFGVMFAAGSAWILTIGLGIELLYKLEQAASGALDAIRGEQEAALELQRAQDLLLSGELTKAEKTHKLNEELTKLTRTQLELIANELYIQMLQYNLFTSFYELGMKMGKADDIKKYNEALRMYNIYASEYLNILGLISKIPPVQMPGSGVGGEPPDNTKLEEQLRKENEIRERSYESYVNFMIDKQNTLMDFMLETNQITTQDYIQGLNEQLRYYSVDSIEFIQIAIKIYNAKKAMYDKTVEDADRAFKREIDANKKAMKQMEKDRKEWEKKLNTQIGSISDGFNDFFKGLKKNETYANKAWGSLFNSMVDITENATSAFANSFSSSVAQIIVEGGNLERFWISLLETMIAEVIKLLMTMALLKLGMALFTGGSSSLVGFGTDLGGGTGWGMDPSTFLDEGGWFTKSGNKMPLTQFKGHYNVNVLPGEIMIPPQKVPEFVSSIRGSGVSVGQISFNIQASNYDHFIKQFKNHTGEIVEIIQSRMYLNG